MGPPAAPRIPQPARAQDCEDGWALQPLALKQELKVCDENGQNDPSGWGLCCPKQSKAGGECLLRRNGHGDILVHDVAHIVVLTVARLKCTAHGSDFMVTNQMVFQQIMDKGLRVLPQLMVLSQQTVVTCHAYMCAPMCMHRVQL